MAWLVAIAVLVLLVMSAGFRKFALAIAVLVAVVGAGVYFYWDWQEKQSHMRIETNQLEFASVLLVPNSYGYRIAGRVKNNARQFTLKAFELSIILQDCDDSTPEPSCVVIGQAGETVHLDVPVGQARDFDESLYFSGGTPRAKGRMTWNYFVVSTTAD